VGWWCSEHVTHACLLGGKLTSHLTAPFFLQTSLIEGIISTTTILWDIFAIALPISPTPEDCANHEMMTPTCPCFQASSISNRSIKYNLIGHCITYSIAHCIQAHSFSFRSGKEDARASTLSRHKILFPSVTKVKYYIRSWQSGKGPWNHALYFFLSWLPNFSKHFMGEHTLKMR
jgi:hypothetical protein